MRASPPDDHPQSRSSDTRPGNAAGLARLAARVQEDLQAIEAGPRAWVPERRDAGGQILCDVVIVGAGLSGLSVAFGLRRQGVERVRLIDAAPAGREGPWVTTARMRTLRSPKTLSGPDLGVPSLTYRAWHEAVYGLESWQALDKIDRTDWMAYLRWFRAVLGLTVENDTRLLAIMPEGEHLRLLVERADGPARISCRKVVLATGLEGAGELNVPWAVRDAVPRACWTHSGEDLAPGCLKGKRVGVLGAAASSFDWAVAALEAGAAGVTVLARAPSLPRTELLDWSNFPGFLNHFADLSDRDRYRFTRRMFAFKTPPTTEMYSRAMASPICRLVMGAEIRGVAMAGDAIHLDTAAGAFDFDHLLLGTGYRIDVAARPELRDHAAEIATWADRFTPPPGEEDATLLGYPYLGPAFELQEKRPGSLPMLAHIHIFNNMAVPSLGPICNGITGLKSGVPKLVAGLCRSLFVSELDHFYRALDGYEKVHFQPQPTPV
ncbi:oxidoreductase [Rhizobium rhizosphaerae]|uniref:Oxidoreductase n=1 Tax=Xaviernesmea rhizosphaerae TaxID=1672749 RepID=A0ABX3PDU5_9HYPH|nr:NAD(P)/FAD-dependent oxidoreductase [Xaviernesmea rhizosphaerae]OQP86444.1 oxidoreductase [Xaviernesmea rhizosphaerae]